MKLSSWFRQQLQGSADGFLWAIEQIPQERLYRAPRPGKWPVARLVYHLIRYEQRIALPSMQQWLGGPRPVVGTQEENAQQEDLQWNDGHGHTIPQLIADFKSVRLQQIELLEKYSESNWLEEQEAIWGKVSLKWVVTKTYQHTLEHTDEILRAYLWWK